MFLCNAKSNQGLRRFVVQACHFSAWAILASSAASIANGADAGTTQAHNKPELAVWLDQHLGEHYQSTGLALPKVIDDATFLRRIYLDLSGRIPVIAEIRDFEDDSDPHKRIKAIDKLLSSNRFNEHTARVWRRILMPPGATPNPLADTSLQDWLEQQFDSNTPYDQLARKLVIAGGAEPKTEEAEEEAYEQPQTQAEMMAMLQQPTPVTYLASTGGQPANMASSVSRVFLGVRLECAQCHDHPFTEWTQQDFWGVAAFFAGARLNPQNRIAALNGMAQPAAVVDSRTTIITDEDGQSYKVSLPWDGEDASVEVPEDELPRQFFARWMTSPANPHFAPTAVNRIWQHLCGSGLTESVDDLDQATEEERAVVIDDLAAKFAEIGFDTKELIRSICASDFYQRPSERVQDATSLEARPLKVLTPEQLFDSLEVALALPISSIDSGPRFNGERDALVNRMAEALGDSPDEFRSGIPQALTLMNGKITADATDLKKSRTLKAVIDAPFLDLYEKVDTLFLTTLSRRPHGPEREKFINYIQEQPSDQEKAEAYSEIMWALINSPEFVLVR